MNQLKTFFIIAGLLAGILSQKNVVHSTACQRKPIEMTHLNSITMGWQTDCLENGIWKTRHVTDGNGNPVDAIKNQKTIIMTTPQTSFTPAKPIYND